MSTRCAGFLSAHWAKTGLRGKAYFAVALPLAFLLHLGIMWVRCDAAQRARGRAALAHAQAFEAVSRNLLDRLLQAEADMNAFLVSGQTQYLSAYRTVEDSAPPLLRRLETLLLDRREALRSSRQLAASTGQLLDSLSALAEFAPRPGASANQGEAQIKTAKAAMAAVRSRLAGLEEVEQRATARAVGNSAISAWFWIDIVCAVAAGFAATRLLLDAVYREQARVAVEAAHTQASRVMAAYEVFKTELIRAGEPSSPLEIGDGGGPAETMESALASVLVACAAPMYVNDAGGRHLAGNAPFDAHHLDEDAARKLREGDAEVLRSGAALWSQEVLSSAAPGSLLRIPLYGADRSVIGVLGIFASTAACPDNHHDQLREAPVLQSVLDSMSDGVVVLDGDGACLFSNPASESMLGEGLRTLPVNDWVSEFGLCCDGSATPYRTEDLPLVQALLGKVVQRADIYVYPSDRAEGLWLAASATPLTDASHRVRGAVGVFSDVTERRKTADALSQAKEEAERANRAKSEFLSRMSHELRTPLNAILGFAQLLQMARLADNNQDSVEQILRGGRHLLDLINEVLDIARIESGHLSLSLERFAASDAVQEAVTLVEPQAAKQKIQLYIEAGPAWRLHVNADRQRFKQVFLNLLSNAVKYNRECGSVRIAAETRESCLRVSVTDTGPGIAPEKIGLLFSPFERLGAEHGGVEGTGIGLALSKRLVEAMAGRIGVASEAGQGTTFWIEFPIPGVPDEDCPAPSPLQRLCASVENGHSPVVLCIEDNDSNYRLIERTLAQRPEIRLVLGTLGASAVLLAEEHRPDIVLLDMHLPDMDGGEVLETLRRNPHTAHIPVVVVSADATTPQRDRMLQAGVSAYLTKPLDIQALLNVVDESIGKGPLSAAPCLEV